MRIDGINNLNMITMPHTVEEKASKNEIGFKDFLKSALESVNQLERNADQSRELLVAGKIDNLHQVMIDSEKASIAVQFTVQIRNRIMDAYSEIMRMQL